MGYSPSKAGTGRDPTSASLEAPLGLTAAIPGPPYPHAPPTAPPLPTGWGKEGDKGIASPPEGTPARWPGLLLRHGGARRITVASSILVTIPNRASPATLSAQSFHS